MAMKKTDLYKNLALTTAQRMKNAAKTPKPGVAEANAKTKKELAQANPLLASLMGSSKVTKTSKNSKTTKSKCNDHTKNQILFHCLPLYNQVVCYTHYSNKMYP